MNLDGARPKVDRADEHRAALAEETSHDREENWLPISAEIDDASGLCLVRISAEPNFPVVRWGLMIGDVVHNLRSALDHLAWQIAHENGKSPGNPRQVQFPIADTATAFRSSSALQQIDPAYWPRVEAFQPYTPITGPDRWSGPPIHPLALLRDLSNEDKHRVVTPIIARSQSFSHTPPMNVGYGFLDFGDSQEALEEGTVVMRLRPAGPNSAVIANPIGLMAPGILFPEKRSVLPTLERIRNFVLKVLDEFS